MSSTREIKMWTPSTILFTLLIVLGAIAIVYRLMHGLGASTNLNDRFPWGLWIGFDLLVGVGLAAGGFVALLDAIAEFKFDAAIGGARRDEEKARAKERFFSFRNEFGAWDPKNQRPELWDIYNTRVHSGENIRVFPISNWTEMDVWQYIAREKLYIPSIYYAHEREIIRRNGQLVPVSHRVKPKPGEKVEVVSVRFRTVGDMTCTAPVASHARTVEQIIEETASTRITERGATRLDDQTSDASMELRKKEGYF